MNRVYKVIWSKAKHCYVVTSEIAKSHTKGESTGRGLKKLAAALLVAAALMGPNFAWAADPTVKVTDTSTVEQIVYTKDGADNTFATKGSLDQYVSKADAAVQDIGVVKAAEKIGANVTALGQGLSDAKAALSGAEEGIKTLGEAWSHEEKARQAADAKLVEAVNSGITLSDDNVLQKNTTSVDADGNVTTAKADVTEMILNKGEMILNKDQDNQITLSEDGIKVGKNSTTMDEKGFYAGSDYDYGNAKAALDATEGKIRGADGDFEVNTDGKVTAKGGVETAGAEIKTDGGSITAGKITGTELNTQGGAITGGMATVTGLTTQGGDISGGNITATGLNTQGGEINGGDIKSSGTIHATGKITGNGLDAGTGAISGGSLSVTGAMEENSLTLKGGNLNAGSGTITTTGDINGNNINTTGKITTKDLEVTGGLKTDHITLGSEDLNQTDINKGKVTSKIHEISGAVEYTAESIFNKDGSSITVRTNEGRVDSTGSSTVGSQIITQYLGNNAVPGGNNVTKRMVRNDNGTFSMVDTAVYRTKSSTVSQNADERKVTVTDGENTASTNLTAADIKNTAENGMISNTAKNLVNTATENMTNTVGKDLTTTVTGDSSLTAENITNEAKNKITNKAIDVETDATSSIVQKVTNDAGSNTSTQWSYQTTEEMSQTDGKTASYLRGAVEEKSELIDGDVKTTIDTIAGQTNTNITDGTNTSNDLQKADQIASSVTDGTNTTVVNQNARSLASSITDGPTKFNNSIHWVGGSEQRIEVDDTHFYAEIRTAEKAEEALKSGNTVIDIVKDTTTATVSSAVFDGATITGISQNAKDISLSAAGGTITNDANDVLNKGANSVINEVGANQVAVMTDSVKAAYGSNTYTTWDDKGITSNTSGNMSNTVGGKMLNDVTGDMENKVGGNLTNSAVEIKNSASTSITDKVGENVERTMGTKKIEESVKDGTKSNTFTKTAKKDMNIITDGTTTSTLSQLADSVNTSLKEVDGAGNTTKSLNNVKTVSEDTTKMTDAASGEFSKRSQTVSQIQDKVGKTTVTTTDGLTKLTDEDHNHTTEMDYANVTKDLSVERNTTLGKEGEDTNLTVNSKSEFKDTVKMDSTLEVDGESTFNNKVTITKGGLDVTGGTTTDTLNVTGETRTGTLHVNGGGYVGGDLNVKGNIETHDAVLSADSRQVVTGRQLYQTNERVDRLDNRIKKVGANAAALAALRPGDFNPDDKFSIAAGFGSYRNANAAALGLFYRPNENVLLSLGTSFGDGENMVNAGVSVKFGRGKSMAERRKEMADEVSSMRDEMRSQDERIAELEEMLKKQSELIEKLSKES